MSSRGRMRPVAAAAAAACVGALSVCSRVSATVVDTLAAQAHAHAAAQPTGPDDARSVFGWWEIIQHGNRAELMSLLSPRWWAQYIAGEFEKEPAHVIVEVVCILTIVYLLAVRKPAPLQQDKLTVKEEDELIREWKPQPLCPPMPPISKTRFVVESVTGREVRANGGQTLLNFASNNFLGLAGKEEIRVACRATIDKYGVGSCGPRGFYGTFDLHLEVEGALAQFLGAEECILYSDSIACVSSLIPAFAKRGDVIVAEESASFAIQQGCLLSRSDVHWFKHRDMADLERLLRELDQKEAAANKKKKSGSKKMLHRKFIVLEGVSSADGSIAPLPQVKSLSVKHKYRVFMDDSLGFGTLGATGRGTLEHFGLPITTFDAVCVANDGALASVGGFCVGSHQIVDHQRLSGAGYCFSASSPPYTSTATRMALGMLADQPELPVLLRAKAQRARKQLASAHRKLFVLGGGESDVSPVIHLGLSPTSAHCERGGPPTPSSREPLEALNALLLAEFSIAAIVPDFIPADHAARQPTLCIVITTLHTEADIDKLVKAVTVAAQKVLGGK